MEGNRYFFDDEESMGFSEYQEESEDGQTIGDYTDYVYGGAPDECNVHWPTKLNADGYCPIVGCRFSLRD